MAEELAARIIRTAIERGATIAVAESLTGGLVVASLVSVPGASAVVRGGVVAYATPLKHSLLGVDAELLAREGAVDPNVAMQMAEGVRAAASVDASPAAFGVATTGVAGPDPQDGRPVGLVYVGVASAAGAESIALQLTGDRQAIRAAATTAALEALLGVLSRNV